ncbi:MAG: putative toxin-antitoxin system toxin component, PIN family [Acidobacteriota bacterium]|nr:putative toxin-antitoxin system toxin component, PIN family [Acidobacteriota bacterium]
MPPRRERIAVVFDTNVLIAFYLSRNSKSAVAKIIRLWRNERKLQMIVSVEIIAEYLEILERVGIIENRIERLKEILDTFGIISKFSLGKIPTESRDVDDNLVLATVLTGKADFLITNDKDLLDISAADKKKFKFRIVTPVEFLNAIGE